MPTTGRRRQLLRNLHRDLCAAPVGLPVKSFDPGTQLVKTHTFGVSWCVCARACVVNVSELPGIFRLRKTGKAMV